LFPVFRDDDDDTFRLSCGSDDDGDTSPDQSPSPSEVCFARGFKRKFITNESVHLQNAFSSGAAYRLLSSNLLRSSIVKALPKELEGTEAQTVVDYLSDVRVPLILYDFKNFI
jgi:hypothetical protein